MRVLLINGVCGYTSTGKICGEIADELNSKGNEVKIAYGRFSYVPVRYQKYGIRIGNAWSVRQHALQTRLFDAQGFGSKKATKRFLKWVDTYNPDLIWLHNLHGYYINIELLFQWIKSHPQISVRWTLHDCWAFTGHCVYFTMVKCNKWKERCQNCPQKRAYPASIWLDRSERNYKKKKMLFCGVKKMQIITPSQWLADQVSQSFLCEYPIIVQHNKIDETVFKPTKSDFRDRYGLVGKTIVLGVANIWEERKGLDDFLKLSRMLDDDYVIVLVGLSTRQIKKMPAKIKGIAQIKEVKELAEIYSASDIYVNASKEETFGMTTLEAAKCGAKVIVYDSTASKEVARKYGGVVVPEGAENIYREITGKDWTGKNKIEERE